MKNTFILFLVATLFLSCAEKLIEKPENLIPQEKMTNILYDISILVSAKNSNKTILMDNDIETMDFIYKKYTIDSLQYVKSDLYYASEPAIYEEMYINVEKRLETEKERMQEEKKKKSDSIIETNKKKSKARDLKTSKKVVKE